MKNLWGKLFFFEVGRVNLVTSALTGNICTGCCSDGEIRRLASNFYKLDADTIKLLDLNDLERSFRARI